MNTKGSVWSNHVVLYYKMKMAVKMCLCQAYHQHCIARETKTRNTGYFSSVFLRNSLTRNTSTDLRSCYCYIYVSQFSSFINCYFSLTLKKRYFLHTYRFVNRKLVCFSQVGMHNIFLVLNLFCQFEYTTHPKSSTLHSTP